MRLLEHFLLFIVAVVVVVFVIVVVLVIAVIVVVFIVAIFKIMVYSRYTQLIFISLSFIIHVDTLDWSTFFNFSLSIKLSLE